MFSVAVNGVPLPFGGTNCAVIVQFWSVASVNPGRKHVLVLALYGATENAAGHRPPIVGVLKVNAVAPRLVTVTDNCLMLGLATVPKLSSLVEIITAVPMPVIGRLNDVSVSPCGSPVNDAVNVLLATPLD